MSKKVDFKAQIRRLQQVSVVAYVGLAALAVWLMSGASYQLNVNYLAKDDLASKTNTVFAPASHPVFEVRLKWLVVIIMLLAAVIPYLQLMRYPGKYQKSLKNRVEPMRWIGMGVVSALMVETIALLSGINDIITLKVIAALMLITCWLGYLSEKENAKSRKPVWPTFAVSVVTATLPWILIAVAAVMTPFYSAVRAPWYIYGLYVTTLATFVFFAKTQMKSHRKVGPWKDYLFVERNYQVASIVSKVAFAAILIVGLHK
ncbi:MAG TPA: heliorhodopsin HeR [Candidatus Saccharimonadales bacterium]|nr:heliorhodopsin HeR [Candidatus Saccharimonadales bacterium]